jgi:archaellum component FlaC
LFDVHIAIKKNIMEIENKLENLKEHIKQLESLAVA